MANAFHQGPPQLRIYAQIYYSVNSAADCNKEMAQIQLWNCL